MAACIIAALLIGLNIPTAVAQAEPAVAGTTVPTVSIDASTGQTMDGFGASGAWWPNDLVSYPRSVREKVANLLFSPDGIDLSSYRYNIGGGGVGVTNPTRAPQSFLVRPAVYNWAADAGGMLFLRLAHNDGVPILVGFVNSAPPTWTTNHASCGGQLDPGAERAYADYLADVVRHLDKVDGITLSYVSPMNEPDNSFSSCGQEGMAVPVSQRAAIVQALGRALAKRAPYAKVIADESSLASLQFLPEVPQWLSVSDTAKWVAALAHHTYEFPTDSMAAQVAPLGPRFDKPLWMTEICCYDGKGPLVGFGQQYDPTMASGLWLADDIYQDLAIIHDSAFDWWTALSSQLGCTPVTNPSCPTSVNPGGWNDGLLYYDPNFRSDHNYSIYTSKRFWVMGNFSRYVRPGAVLHPANGVPNGLKVLAFSQGHSWSIIVINDSQPGVPPARLRITVPSNGALRCTNAVQTSAASNLSPANHPNGAEHGGFLLRVPAQSVTTYTFEMRGGFVVPRDDS